MATESHLPRYKCHKEVSTLKIQQVVEDHINPEKPFTVYFDDPHFAPVQVTKAWADRFPWHLKDPGYYVVYEDGYTSWSPTKAFEEGYTLIE